MQQPIQSDQFSDDAGNPEGGVTQATGLLISWQRGPLGSGADRVEPNGCFVETVIAAAIDRLEFYQRSKFISSYNAGALGLLYEALDVLHARTADRELRGVEGTHSL
jgi:hypothetical protein